MVTHITIFSDDLERSKCPLVTEASSASGKGTNRNSSCNGAVYYLEESHWATPCSSNSPLGNDHHPPGPGRARVASSWGGQLQFNYSSHPPAHILPLSPPTHPALPFLCLSPSLVAFSHAISEKTEGTVLCSPPPHR